MTPHPTPSAAATPRVDNCQEEVLRQPPGRDFHEYAVILDDIRRTPRRDLLTTVRLVLAGQRL